MVDEVPGNDSKQQSINLQDPGLILNRELSWLEFNRRVLEEAEDPHTPTMEKLKFLSIFCSNLDEFYMIRVGSLAQVSTMGIDHPDVSGRTPRQQLDEIAHKVRGYIQELYTCFQNEVVPLLGKAGITLLAMTELTKKELSLMRDYFREQVFPVLTPLAVDAGHPFPFLGNLRLNLMVIFAERIVQNKPKAYAFVEVPSVLPRLIRVRGRETGIQVVFLEDLITTHIDLLFPGLEVKRCIPFRVTRNLDYDLQEIEVMDLLQSIEEELHDRSNKIAVRLEIQDAAPQPLVDTLCHHLRVDRKHVYRLPGPINLCGLMALYDFPVHPAYRDPPFNPRIPKCCTPDRDLFSVIRERDILLHHPFDSFAVVVDFVNAAADDPHVLAIKQSLYRTGRDSPIVAALRRAAENGKQVTAVVELKARFDEKSNINWARQMEDDGINVVYGFVNWKTHCKATLVVRKEGDHLTRYVHLSTGNYNTNTAKLYTDLGLLTVDPDFGADVSALFNVITGFNSWTGGNMFQPETVVSMFKAFMVSPVNLKQGLIELIDGEIRNAKSKKPARIIAKMNGLLDADLVRKLYEASQTGVKVELIVRGICALRPGLPGISDNIKVISILDRFLEHTRIYYFLNDGDPRIYSGSADWMQRNLYRRVEILYPIKSKEAKERIIHEILETYLADNVKARVEQPDGSYRRVVPENDIRPIRSQLELIATARKGGIKSKPYDEAINQGKRKKRKKK